MITTVTGQDLLAHFLALNRERRGSAAGNDSGIVGASPIGTQLTSDAFQLTMEGEGILRLGPASMDSNERSRYSNPFWDLAFPYQASLYNSVYFCTPTPEQQAVAKQQVEVSAEFVGHETL
jgi:hypothetical protein